MENHATDHVRPISDLTTAPVIPPLAGEWAGFDPRKWGCNIVTNPTYEQIKALCAAPVWIIDVETDESDDQRIFGFGIARDDKELFWFDFGVVNYPTALMALINEGLRTKLLVGHNVLFDVECLRNAGIAVSDSQILWDTYLGSATEDPTKDTHALKDISEKELGLVWPHYADMTKRQVVRVNSKGKEVKKTVKVTLKEVYEQHPNEVINYNAVDLVAPYRLMFKQQQALAGNRLQLFKNVELPIACVTRAMKQKGLRVDRPGLQRKEIEYAQKEIELKEQIISETGDVQFNPNSPQQVLRFLKGRGLDIKSTGEEVLRPLVGQDPWLGKLLEFRGITKLLGTYVRPLLEHSTKDGRIHTNFNQVARMANGKERPIITGRFSSSDPINLQNQPPEMREFFIPEEGHAFVCADYSQIDLRSLAHLSLEPVYTEAFRKGEKVHQAVADQFKVEYKLGKIISLALAYNGGPGRLMQEAQSWGYDLPYWMCEKYSQEFITKLSTLTAWKRTEYAKAKRLGGVFTLFGRWIPLPFPNDAQIKQNRYCITHWENCVIAFQGQGGTADIVKGGMLRLWKNGIVANAQVHDELLIEFPEDEVKDRAKQVQYELEHVITLRVPLVAEVGTGSTWASAKPK